MAHSLWRGVAIMFTVLAIAATVVAVIAPGEKRVDFDVTGFLWMITNTPKICAWTLAIFFGAMAIHGWVRTAQASDE